MRGADERRLRRMPHTPQGGARRQRSRWAVFIGRSYGGVVMARKEGLIGRKAGMTQVFSEDGRHVPVTVVEAGPCPVIEIRAREPRGSDARQIGFGAETQ